MKHFKLILMLVFLSINGMINGQQIQWSGFMNSETINAIAEEDNYLWLGTTAGVIKYDKNNNSSILYSKYNAPFPNNHIYSVAVDNNKVVWFGTYAGIVKFDGVNWSVFTTANSGLLSNYVRGIAVDKNNNKWFATYNGLVKYDGSKWTVFTSQSNSQITSNNFNCVAVDDSNKIWAGTTSDFYQTGGLFKFDGSNWTAYTMQNSSIPDYIINTILINGGLVWLGSNYSGLIKFDGFNFTSYTTNNSNIADLNITGLTTDKSNNIWIATKAYAKSGGVSKFDGSEFTNYIKSKGNFPSATSLSIFSGSDGKIYSGTANGFAIFNGSGWSLVKVSNNGLPSNSINCILIDSKNNKWFGTADAGLAKYDGTNWFVYDTTTSNKLPHNAVLSLVQDNNGVIWVGTKNGIVKINNNNFSTFNNASSTPVNADWVQGITIDKNNVKWFATSSTLISYNDANWVYYNSGNISILPSYSNNFMNVFIDASGNIWCGVLGFGAIKYDGTNWVSYTPSNSSLTYADVENFEQDNNGKIWIGTFGQGPDGQNGGIYTLDGTNWRNIRQNNSSLLGNYINSIRKAVTGEIWIGSTYYGTSFGGGLSIIKNPADPTSSGAIQTLTPDNSNLPYPWITDIKFDNNGNAWMGLYGYGIAIYNPSGITSVRKENTEKVIVDYSLLQNYPNPFNPSTTIKYSLPKLSYVTIKVYDVLGREITTLVHENKTTGNYSVEFNASKLVSGIYFYRMEAGSYSQTKKLLLVK